MAKIHSWLHLDILNTGGKELTNSVATEPDDENSDDGTCDGDEFCLEFLISFYFKVWSCTQT
jgi:hypothetical protein